MPKICAGEGVIGEAGDDRGDLSSDTLLGGAYEGASGSEDAGLAAAREAEAAKPCPNCGENIEPTCRWCPKCGRVTGWTRRAPESGEPGTIPSTEEAAPTGEPPRTDEQFGGLLSLDRPKASQGQESAVGYRSPVGRARAVQLLLALWVLLAAVAAAASLVEWRLVSRFLSNPLSVSASQFEASDDRQVVLGVIWIAGMVLTAIAFVVWMLRIYDNVWPLRSHEPRHSRGWVIGGWLVPILNFWRPKQVMDDLWKGSDPSSPPSGGATVTGSVSPLLHVWWGLWIVGGFGGQYLFRTRDVEDLEGLRTYAAVDAAVDLIFAVAAIAGFAVVTLLSQRQEDRAACVFSDHEARSVVGGHNLRAILAGFAVTAAVVLALGFVLFDNASAETLAASPGTEAEPSSAEPASIDSSGDASPQTTTALVPGRAALLADLTTGDCWNNQELANAADAESVTLLAVEVVPCDQPHMAEVYALQRHPGRSSDPFPGDFEMQIQAALICTKPFEDIFGHKYESSSLGISPIFPQADSWRAGDRTVICSVSSLTGDSLPGPAKEIDTRLPGTEIDVLGADSCDDLVDIMLINAQALIDVIDSLTDEQLSLLGPADLAPGSERYLKRDVAIIARGLELGCTISGLNDGFIPHADTLTASTLTGDAIVNMYATGYFNESLLPGS